MWPTAGDGADVDDLPDGGHRPVDLGGDGDHPDGAAARGEHPVDLGGVGGAQGGRVVRPLLARREPRTLQVDAADQAVLDLLGQRRHLTQQFVGVGRHQRRDQRRRAVRPVQAHGRARRLLGRVGERPAARAVDVHVDEARHHGDRRRARDPVTRRTRWLALAETPSTRPWSPRSSPAAGSSDR